MDRAARSAGQGPLLAAMFAGWPFAQFVQNYVVDSRPAIILLVAIGAAVVGSAFVFLPTLAALYEHASTPRRSWQGLRVSTVICLLGLVAAVSTRIGRSLDDWLVTSSDYHAAYGYIATVAAATLLGTAGMIRTDLLIRLLGLSSVASLSILVSALIELRAVDAGIGAPLSDLDWNWVLDGLVLTLPAMAFAAVVAKVLLPRNDTPKTSQAAPWVVVPVALMIAVTLAIEGMAVGTRGLDQFMFAVDWADREMQRDGLWVLLVSLTGLPAGLVASVAIHRLARGHRATVLGLVVLATGTWGAQTEPSWLVAVLALAMLAIYLLCALLIGETLVRGRVAAPILEDSCWRWALLSPGLLTVSLLALIALTAVTSASGSTWVAVVAPFLASIGVGAIRGSNER